MRKILKKIYYSVLKKWRIEAISKIIDDTISSENHSKLLILDIGSGDSLIINRINEKFKNVKIVALDVMFYYNKNHNFKVIYDGKNFPFKNNVFDYIFLIDVIHHINNTEIFFKNCINLSRKKIIIKDHYCNNIFDRTILLFLDFIGNKFNGVSLPYNYMNEKKWLEIFQINNLKIIKLYTKLRIYPVILSQIFNRNLHFMTLLEHK